MWLLSYYIPIQKTIIYVVGFILLTSERDETISSSSSLSSSSCSKYFPIKMGLVGARLHEGSDIVFLTSRQPDVNPLITSVNFLTMKTLDLRWLAVILKGQLA